MIFFDILSDLKLTKEFWFLGMDINKTTLGASIMEGKAVFHHSIEVSQKLAEISPAGILHLDKNMKITYKNPALKKMMNEPDTEAEKYIGMSIFDLASVQAAGLVPLFKQIQEAAIITDFETEFTSVYGKSIVVELHSTPLFDDDGNFDGARKAVSSCFRRK